MPLGWMRYVPVQDVSEAACRAVSYGGAVIVRPFAVSDITRIALITDSNGALVGLREPVEMKGEADGVARSSKSPGRSRGGKRHASSLQQDKAVLDVTVVLLDAGYASTALELAAPRDRAAAGSECGRPRSMGPA